MFKGPALPDAVPTKEERYVRSHAMERVDSGPVMIGISDLFIASSVRWLTRCEGISFMLCKTGTT